MDQSQRRAAAPRVAATSTYYPGPDQIWERRKPEEVGIASELLQEAIAFATDRRREGYPPDLGTHLAAIHGSKRYDDGVILGPTKPHGAMTGIVLRHGYLVAEWGEPDRVDMTFSITKSFLSTVAGLAWDRGLIRDVHDRVKDYVDDGGFDSPHNAQITWEHFLRQTNEWDGTLWDKPYSAGSPDDQWRPPAPPGTYYEYNDVRVNRFSLSLLRLWRRPLPEVLKELVMDPIDASQTSQWHGYRNSWVSIDGQPMQSVSGGGHWGGGMWISARDLARFGYLTLRRGRWRDRQVLSESWFDMATTPTPVQPTYGFMNYFLNTDRQLFPSAPASHYYHAGAGANRVWVAPDLDMVVVVRWLAPEHFDGFVKRVLAAVKP
ncbi:MAG TPA: serine hydrolase [Alphaproteobacteria bacterium]|nr:serine hydrolase [Alphaproteobacteria bacterium]